MRRIRALFYKIFTAVTTSWYDSMTTLIGLIVGAVTGFFCWHVMEAWRDRDKVAVFVGLGLIVLVNGWLILKVLVE